MKDSKTTEPSGGQNEDLDQRLANLRTKLDGPDGKRLADRADPDSAAEKRRRKDVSQALKLSSEFIAGIIVGAVLGYAIDILFDTSPWGLIVFLLLGFAAAILNVMRSAGFVAPNEVQLKTSTPPSSSPTLVDQMSQQTPEDKARKGDDPEK